jgi:threonine aldolase
LIGGGESLRLVTHLDVSSEDIERTVAAFKKFFAGWDK